MWCTPKDPGTDESLRRYINSFKIPNFIFKGWCPAEKLVETMNSYKFFVVPHHGYEPHMSILSQIIPCGTIPLLVNSRNYEGSEWSNYTKGMIYEFPTVDSLISTMENFAQDKYPEQDMDKVSEDISRVFHKKYSYDNFQKILLSMIEGTGLRSEVILSDSKLKWRNEVP